MRISTVPLLEHVREVNRRICSNRPENKSLPVHEVLFFGRMLGMNHFLEPRKSAFGIYGLHHPPPITMMDGEREVYNLKRLVESTGVTITIINKKDKSFSIKESFLGQNMFLKLWVAMIKSLMVEEFKILNYLILGWISNLEDKLNFNFLLIFLYMKVDDLVHHLWVATSSD